MTDDPHALRPGASIAGYDIVRVLGAGGFGITYEAESPYTGKRVAIKEFFPRGIASRDGGTKVAYSARDAEIVEWALKRFESSTLDQCKLRHPNIVNVIHYVKDNDTGYMIMEYVEGETLEEWLRAREYLPTAEELQPVIAPVMAALEYLHTQKMIHRDIAPDNIMIRADGEPMIIDFGAIKLIGEATQARSAAKTFTVMKQFYSPPEQTEDSAGLDHRADIYSIGAVLYRAFSGYPPAGAEDRMQKRAFGKDDPYVPLHEHTPHLSPEVTEAVDRALAFDAENRFPTIADLRDALHWQEESENPPSFLYPDAKDEAPRRRSILPWLLPLIGIAALLVAGAYVGGFIKLPMFETEIVKAPEPPQLPEVKEIPQPPLPPEQNTQQQQPPQQEQETAVGYMVVVASQQTELEAQAALNKLKAELPALFVDQHTEVTVVDLGGSGRFYRAMVGPLTKEDADTFCQELKKNKVSCLVRLDN